MIGEKEPRGREYLLPGDDDVEKSLTNREPFSLSIGVIAIGVLGLIIGAQTISEKVRNLKDLIKKSTPQVKVLSSLLL